MPYVYKAEKRKVLEDEMTIVPDYEGLHRWRWIAQDPWWYFESDVPLDAPEAPETYPNGVPVWDPGLVEPMQDHKELLKRVKESVQARKQIPKTVDQMTDDELLAEIKRRGLDRRVTGEGLGLQK